MDVQQDLNDLTDSGTFLALRNAVSLTASESATLVPLTSCISMPVADSFHIHLLDSMVRSVSPLVTSEKQGLNNVSCSTSVESPGCKNSQPCSTVSQAPYQNCMLGLQSMPESECETCTDTTEEHAQSGAHWLDCQLFSSDFRHSSQASLDVTTSVQQEQQQWQAWQQEIEKQQSSSLIPQQQLHEEENPLVSWKTWKQPMPQTPYSLQLPKSMIQMSFPDVSYDSDGCSDSLQQQWSQQNEGQLPGLLERLPRSDVYGAGYERCSSVQQLQADELHQYSLSLNPLRCGAPCQVACRSSAPARMIQWQDSQPVKHTWSEGGQDLADPDRFLYLAYSSEEARQLNMARESAAAAIAAKAAEYQRRAIAEAASASPAAQNAQAAFLTRQFSSRRVGAHLQVRSSCPAVMAGGLLNQPAPEWMVDRRVSIGPSDAAPSRKKGQGSQTTMFLKWFRHK